MKALSVVCVAVLVLSGCGLSRIGSDEYELKTTASSVVAEYAKRDEAMSRAIEGLLSIGATNKDKASEALDAVTESRNAAVKAQEMGGDLEKLDAVGQIAGKKVSVLVTDPTVVRKVAGNAELSEHVKAMVEAMRAVEVARMRYTIAAKTYNSIIGMYPVKVGAMLTGVKPYPLLAPSVDAHV